MPIINVYNRKLKEQLERKGFIFSGSVGEGIDKPIRYCLAGDMKKLSKREKPFCQQLGRLKQKDEYELIYSQTK